MRLNYSMDFNPNSFFLHKLFLQPLPLNIQMILIANTYSNIGHSGDRAQPLEQRTEDLEE
ncbi:hypothetical protein T10_10407 [Trichinella papuae]|uniref:Uncharacterized protein n=1 Tax=Trichinella papuae TaxID=268474 RepID=A0A0V1MNH3_9BILA|nr:hypothetical protein T10_10407 [Trichinella papuae]